MSPALIGVLVIGASAVQAAFGVWHFFVPRLWGWYDYIAPTATELVLAVRAINFFFSLCLVLMAVENLLLVLREPPWSFGLRLLLASSTFLWVARVAMQIAFPQGSMSPGLRYGMLAIFVGVASAYGLAFAGTLVSGSSAGPPVHSPP